ncbi:hypothetical protein BGX28_002298, partial [Mortierella sp. GBA30]
PDIYTLHALAEQANNTQDPMQVLQHLQGNMGALQQQVENLQAAFTHTANNNDNNNHNNNNDNAPLVSLQATITALSAQCHETMQANHALLTGMHTVLENLAQRPQSPQRRAPIPQPLSTKFTGLDKDLTLSDFKGKIANTIARFPEHMSTDHNKIQFALNSMDSPAF